MKSIRERVESYKRYEPENILLAMAETEELMVQVSRATTLEMAQELARAWLLVWNTDQEPRDDRLGVKPCNCGSYRRGELTGGWQCPTHGQQW